MVIFPNCKINLGLNVLAKRSDGFHSLQTVFYPIEWTDALEVIENTTNKNDFELSQSGLTIQGEVEQNIIFKAWKLIHEKSKLPGLKVHLHKNIPMGAGLGGGSSDAAHFIRLLNEKFSLNFSQAAMLEMAQHLGSDCAFFINNMPSYAEGKGEILSPLNLILDAFYILVIYPSIHCNTAEAYASIKMSEPKYDLRELIQNNDVKDWRDKLTNDFETSIFEKHPSIKKIKETLYNEGALYASMSGSGSAVFGIFSNEPDIALYTTYTSFLQKPKRKIL